MAHQSFDYLGWTAKVELLILDKRVGVPAIADEHPVLILHKHTIRVVELLKGSHGGAIVPTILVLPGVVLLYKPRKGREVVLHTGLQFLCPGCTTFKQVLRRRYVDPEAITHLLTQDSLLLVLNLDGLLTEALTFFQELLIHGV